MAADVDVNKDQILQFYSFCSGDICPDTLAYNATIDFVDTITYFSRASSQWEGEKKNEAPHCNLW